MYVLPTAYYLRVAQRLGQLHGFRLRIADIATLGTRNARSKKKINFDSDFLKEGKR